MYLPEVVIVSCDRFHPFGKFEFMGSLEDALEYLKLLKVKADEPGTFLNAVGTKFYLYRFEAESVEYPGLEDLAAAARRPPVGV